MVLNLTKGSFFAFRLRRQWDYRFIFNKRLDWDEQCGNRNGYSYGSCFLFAMYEKDGMPLEKILFHIIQVKLQRPAVRKYEIENFYEKEEVLQTERKKKEGSLMVDRMDNRKPVKLTRSEKKP